jgi:hypothetical protein
MPALEIRTSSQPKAPIVLATQASVCVSLVTSTATPIARLAPPSSAATASAPLLIKVSDHDPRALTGKQHGNVLADAAGRSGDNRNFIFK